LSENRFKEIPEEEERDDDDDDERIKSFCPSRETARLWMIRFV